MNIIHKNKLLLNGLSLYPNGGKDELYIHSVRPRLVPDGVKYPISVTIFDTSNGIVLADIKLYDEILIFMGSGLKPIGAAQFSITDDAALEVYYTEHLK